MSAASSPPASDARTDAPHATPPVRRLRIAHVIHGLGVGGLETGVINLLGALDPATFEHRLYCLRELGPNAARAEALGASVELVGAREGRDRAMPLKLARRFRAWRPDVVHTRNFGCLDGILGARLARVRAVVHGEHGWDTADPQGSSRKRRFARGCVSPLVTRYITVSHQLRDWLLGHRGFFRGKIVAIHNGVDTERFRPPARARGSADGGLVIGTIGRLVPIKDQASLIDAFARIAGEFPRARLRIVGDGPLRGELEARARATGFAERIDLPGGSAEPEREYDRLDVFTLPSLNEGISNTILEAMASGLPVVATAVGGNPELVESGVTGACVPKEDPAALADALRRYLAEPSLIAQHGEAGRRRALEAFSIPRMAGAYRDVYLEVARASARGAR